MQRLWIGSLVVLLATASSGQVRVGGDVLTFRDFKRLGSILLPASDHDDQSFYGGGIAVYRQPADDNNIHIVYGAYRPCDGKSSNWPLYEIRYQTPQNPADPTDMGAYTRPAILKSYGTAPYVGRDGKWKRLTKVRGADSNANCSSGPDFFGLGFGPDQKLYWAYALTYADGSDTTGWTLGRSVLNYATPTASYGEGPWGLSAQQNKAVGGGVLMIPPAYSKAYLGGKPLALGCGGYPSQAASGDASYGLSLTAIDVPTGAEKSYLASTDIMGYWPFAGSPGGGRDRANRPEPIVNLLDGGERSWAPNKWTWDQIEGGCVWIDTGTKRGVIGFTTQTMGVIDYLFSAPAQQATAMYWVFYDPNQFKPVTGGKRSDAQPTSWQQVVYPETVKRYDKVTTYGTASIITSTKGVGHNDSGTSGGRVRLTAHGLSKGDAVTITGNTVGEYNGIWGVSNIISPDEFTIWSPNDSTPWAGAAGKGGAVTSTVGNAKLRHQGSYFFENLLFVRWSREGNAAGTHGSFVEVYQVQ